MKRPLAKDTNAAVERELVNCRNLGLILDKFQPWQQVSQQVNRGGWDLFMDGTRDTPAGSAARGAWFTGRVSRGDLKDPWLNPNSRIEEGVLTPFLARWQIAVKAVGAEVVTMWTESPLIIGLGAKGTLETTLTLHPLYGFPYIPGSALKGIARAAAFFDLAGEMGIEGVDNKTFAALRKKKEKTPLQELAQVLDDDARLDEKDVAKWPERFRPFEKPVREFRRLFGWRGAAGRAVFFEGVPARVPVIVSEVMTPHFKGYYDGKVFPHDADSPNPISLLAVARRTEFYFAVGRRPGPPDPVLEPAKKYLIQGLEELGLGGKTAAGYGFFLDGEPPPARRPVTTREPDVSGYRRPRPAGTGGGKPGGRTVPDLVPEKPETRSIAEKAEARLAEAAREREEKEKERLARKEAKKKKGKKK